MKKISLLVALSFILNFFCGAQIHQTISVHLGIHYDHIFDREFNWDKQKVTPLGGWIVGGGMTWKLSANMGISTEMNVIGANTFHYGLFTDDFKFREVETIFRSIYLQMPLLIRLAPSNGKSLIFEMGIDGKILVANKSESVAKNSIFSNTFNIIREGINELRWGLILGVGRSFPINRGLWITPQIRTLIDVNNQQFNHRVFAWELCFEFEFGG